MRCKASIALALDSNALVCSEVALIGTACGSTLIMDVRALRGLSCTLIRYAVSKHAVLRLTVQDLVVLIFPLLA